MTLDEAIERVDKQVDDWEADAKTWLECIASEEPRPIGEPRERAEEAYANCKKCAEEHRQLAEWLRELKEYKKLEPCEDWDCISRKEAIFALNEAQVEYDEYYRGLGKAKVIIDNMRQKVR